ncbi:MAG: hypothetical protein EA381_03875 [Planctomycetaceae bacterium]|nr:MAG: hypothetical protein EA381_03875 [Planctomycetaceae bacterium]
MAVVLKSPTVAIGQGQPAPAGLAGFNFEDLSQRAKSQLETCDRELVRIRERAVAEAKRIQQQAHEEGLQAGRAVAAAEADERLRHQVEERVGKLVSATEGMLRQITESHQAWMADYAESLTATAVAIAERVVRQCLRQEPELIARWAEEALWAARSADRLTVAVHPETLAELGPKLDELLTRPGLPEDISIIPDETVPREGVSVRQTGGEVSATLQGQLERLAEALNDA